LLKLAVPALIAIVSSASTLIYFYLSTKQHMANDGAHLRADERGKLETKTDARVRTKSLIGVFKRDLKLRTREIKVEQREQIQAATKKLAKDQRAHYIQILNEVRQTRRAVRRTAPAAPP
jgi:hypothetical protein